MAVFQQAPVGATERQPGLVIGFSLRRYYGWQIEGFFRTYKRTLAKVKLRSRTVRLVHREAEGAMLAAQLLLAQGAYALRPRTARARATAPACSPRQVLLAIREEMQAARPPRRPSFGARLAAAR